MLAIALRFILKPIAVAWLSLNVLDDLSLVIRVARLGAVLLPGGDETDMCGVCDDVMGDLLKGDGIEAVSCKLVCLRLPSCVRMCEHIKAVSQNSSHFPCMAAGYCRASDELEEVDVTCSVAPILRCVPSRYCAGKRNGLSLSCELKPGFGRWVGMKNTVSTHTAAIAHGLLSQPHCGEEGAGAYCIAAPKGFGFVAEMTGHVLSLLYGGLRTIISIETPGGDDDRQWLTFWLVLSVLLFAERFLARVILSSFPLYYEIKLIGLLWLLFADGADAMYRRLRLLALRICGSWLLASQAAAERRELDSLRQGCPELVQRALEHDAGRGQLTPPGSVGIWEEVREGVSDDETEVSLGAVSRYMLTPAGGELLAGCAIDEQQKAILLESAASRASFQPRFVRVNLIGVAPGLETALPSMDSNGKADPYVTCWLVSPAGGRYPFKGVRSRTKYRTVRPQWRGQTLELTIQGGSIGADGVYRNFDARGNSLVLQASAILGNCSKSCVARSESGKR